MHLSRDTGLGPRRDVCVILVAADKHALQRVGVLGPMGMSRDIRKNVSHITAVQNMGRKHCEAQLGKG